MFYLATKVCVPLKEVYCGYQMIFILQGTYGVIYNYSMYKTSDKHEGGKGYDRDSHSYDSHTVSVKSVTKSS